jgi:hypothetical protein
MNNIFLEFENHSLLSRLLRVMPLEKQLRSVKMFFLALLGSLLFWLWYNTINALEIHKLNCLTLLKLLPPRYN